MITVGTARRSVPLFVLLWTTVTSSPLQYLEVIMTCSPKQDAVIPGTARTATRLDDRFCRPLRSNVHPRNSPHSWPTAIRWDGHFRRPQKRYTYHRDSPHSWPHCNKTGWPLRAALEQVYLFQGQPSLLAHCNKAKWPFLAASEQVFSSQGQPSLVEFIKLQVSCCVTLCWIPQPLSLADNLQIWYLNRPCKRPSWNSRCEFSV